MGRALYATEWGDTAVLEVRERELDAVAPQQIRVRVHFSGANYIDVYKRRGIYRETPPFVLGEEGAGVVTAVGDQVDGVAVGDRVAWVNVTGSIAEDATLPQQAVVPVPDGIGLDIACAAMVQGLTAHALARSVWPVQPGDIALVHAAAGGVGQLLLQLLTRADVRVVATAGAPEKLELAAKLGAQHIIDYRDFAGDGPGLATRIRDIAGRGVDIAYDGVGAATFDASLRSLRPRGLLALYGAASGQVPPLNPQLLNRYGSLYVTRPSLVHYLRDRDELRWRAHEMFGAIQRGEVTVQVSRVYRIDDAAQAYADLESRRSTGKLLFRLV